MSSRPQKSGSNGQPTAARGRDGGATPTRESPAATTHADDLAGGRRREREFDGSGETERRIFAATERLLADQPLRELKVEQILTESGVSRRTFYVYFSSKLDILPGLARFVMDDIYAAISPVFDLEPGEPGPVALRRALEGGCATWAQHGPVLRAIVQHWLEVPALQEMWLDRMATFTDGIAAVITAERAEGRAPPGVDPFDLAAALNWSTAHLLYVSGLGVVDQFPADARLIDTCVTLWTSAVYGPNARQSDADDTTPNHTT